ncbi:hypothetical protein MKW98_001027 [Papaver atlanticum]|uniref:Uncharacterized protein n=1 Tax=Papaver atlanticum TaxID=357466 RepID=A0AAD4TIX4_9MAGN|nr:hypothetical protein MKW98_001027 [Papaver atlanticum]
MECYINLYDLARLYINKFKSFPFLSGSLQLRPISCKGLSLYLFIRVFLSVFNFRSHFLPPSLSLAKAAVIICCPKIQLQQ